MTTRYWLSFGLFLLVLVGFVALLAWAFAPGTLAWAPFLAAIIYVAAALLDLAPPGRPQQTAAVIASRPTHGVPPATVIPSRAARRVQPAAADARARAGPRLSNTALFAVVLAFAGVAVAVATALALLSSSGDDGPPASDDAVVAATLTPAVSPTARATATRTATAAPTPSATAVPPTATPTALPATPTPVPPDPTPPPARATAGPISLTGRWQIVDTVTTGRDAGQTFTFTVDMQESLNLIVGSGGGFILLGERRGASAIVSYTRIGGSGVFRWLVQSDGTLSGTFEDLGAGNSGPARPRGRGKCVPTTSPPGGESGAAPALHCAHGTRHQ
ncbi:MAG: hypothetical protein ACR2HN_09585 [Tepidiformaceae bacterium]